MRDNPDGTKVYRLGDLLAPETWSVKCVRCERHMYCPDCVIVRTDVAHLRLYGLRCCECGQGIGIEKPAEASSPEPEKWPNYERNLYLVTVFAWALVVLVWYNHPYFWAFVVFFFAGVAFRSLALFFRLLKLVRGRPFLGARELDIYEVRTAVESVRDQEAKGEEQRFFQELAMKVWSLQAGRGD